ncbi:hypothetical protein OG361_37920 [Streptomyces sp. NBC_00090]|uniref:hypothetical protein n=1 Tax=Streptomyces sp. NBC_00090 TaxID=2903619 RepID=UPI0032484EEE
MVELFTGAYGDNLQEEGAADRNRSMQNGLNTFLDGLSGADLGMLERTALTVVALEDGIDTHAWAGHRHQEVHYSASLVKLLAMYAAHTLRFFSETVRQEQHPATADDLFVAVDSAFTTPIKNHVPMKIKAVHGAAGAKIVPVYRTVLKAEVDSSGKPIAVVFAPGYVSDLERMLLHQENDGAAACIHGVAFGFMNGKSVDDGFFNLLDQRGIWLAGDYLGQWTPVPIPSTNDGLVAQATTAIDMARLFTRMFDGSLESGAPADLFHMLAGSGRSWFHDRGVWSTQPGQRLVATHSKVGIGPLKANSAGIVEQVVSEALIVHDRTRHMNFVVVWQNLKVPKEPGQPKRPALERVARMVESAVLGFVPT